MMIRYQNLKPDILCMFHLVTGYTSAVHSHNKASPCRLDFVQGLAVEAIPFVKSGRNIVSQVVCQMREHLHEHRGGSNAVSIIVSINANLLLFLNSRQY